MVAGFWIIFIDSRDIWINMNRIFISDPTFINSTFHFLRQSIEHELAH